MKVINYNENRYAKKTFPHQMNRVEPVQIKEFRNPRDEYMAVAGLLRNRMEEGDNIEDTALLSGLIRKPKAGRCVDGVWGSFHYEGKTAQPVPTLDLPEYDRLFENGRRRPEPQYISGDHEPAKPIHSQRRSDRKKR